MGSVELARDKGSHGIQLMVLGRNLETHNPEYPQPGRSQPGKTQPGRDITRKGFNPEEDFTCKGLNLEDTQPGMDLTYKGHNPEGK